MEFLSKIGRSSDDSLLPKHMVAEIEQGRRQHKEGGWWFEDEQQMAWNYLDLQLNIYAHDAIICGVVH